MTIFCVDNLPREIVLGRQTETGVTSVGFDCSHWLEKWPGLSLHVWVTAPGAQTSYPAASRILGGVLSWDVSAADTAQAGSGSAEIVGLADGKKKLSATVATKILPSATAQPGEAPEAQQPWVDKVLDAAERAEAAAKRAEAAEGGGVAFEVDETLTLANGILSVNTAESVEQDNTLPVTSAAVHKALGDMDLKDGISPTVEITEITGGHKVSITDANGTQTFDVMDGEAGFTPVKGKDYYTDADKADIVRSVIEDLPVYTGEVADA